MTVAATNEETTWAFRYATHGQSRAFHSTDIGTLRLQSPDNPVLHDLSDDTRLIVSDPLGDLQGAWQEVPESSCVIVRGGTHEVVPFDPEPHPPPRSGREPVGGRAGTRDLQAWASQPGDSHGSGVLLPGASELTGQLGLLCGRVDPGCDIHDGAQGGAQPRVEQEARPGKNENAAPV
jgi:hypothetical protein